MRFKAARQAPWATQRKWSLPIPKRTQHDSDPRRSAEPKSFPLHEGYEAPHETLGKTPPTEKMRTANAIFKK